MKSYVCERQNITNSTLIEAIDSINYLEENDEIFAERLNQIHSEKFSSQDMSLKLSPQDTKNFLGSMVVSNPIFSFRENEQNSPTFFSPMNSNDESSAQFYEANHGMYKDKKALSTPIQSID